MFVCFLNCDCAEHSPRGRVAFEAVLMMIDWSSSFGQFINGSIFQRELIFQAGGLADVMVLLACLVQHFMLRSGKQLWAAGSSEARLPWENVFLFFLEKVEWQSMKVYVSSHSLGILSSTSITPKVLCSFHPWRCLLPFLTSSQDLNVGDSCFVSLPQFSYL